MDGLFARRLNYCDGVACMIRQITSSFFFFFLHRCYISCFAVRVHATGPPSETISLRRLGRHVYSMNGTRHARLAAPISVRTHRDKCTGTGVSGLAWLSQRDDIGDRNRDNARVVEQNNERGYCRGIVGRYQLFGAVDRPILTLAKTCCFFA